MVKIKQFLLLILLFCIRIRHCGQGEPYLHVDEDVLVVPGDAKYVCRVLVYDRYTKSLASVRDLDHKKYWVLGAFIGE